MADIISSNEIESTDAFKKLDKFQQSLIVKRANREIIDNAMNIYRNTKQISEGLGTTHKKIILNLIEIYEKENPSI